MFQFIIGITLIALLLQFPSTLIIAGIISLAIYLYVKRPDLFAKLGIRIPTEFKSSEPEDDLPPEVDRSERYRQESEKRMKPGYKNDPEWQQMAADLRKTRAKNRVAADKELRLEMLLEAEEYAKKQMWSEVDRIQRELRNMEA